MAIFEIFAPGPNPLLGLIIMFLVASPLIISLFDSAGGDPIRITTTLSGGIERLAIAVVGMICFVWAFSAAIIWSHQLIYGVILSFFHLY